MITSKWLNEEERAELHKLLDRMVDEQNGEGVWCYVDYRTFKIQRFNLFLEKEEQSIC